MKTLITLFTAVLLSQAITAQTTLIPDANFEQALINLGYDTGTPDGSVLTANISSVITLSIANKNISDLTGIEDFIVLGYLACSNNLLTSLDVSNNTALYYLECIYNQLTSLDVSGATALVSLKGYGNQLTSLDVSLNTALTTLYCSSNQLTSLDVSQNPAIVTLFCAYNQLTNLDVSQNTAILNLYCNFNQLTSLDVSQNTALVVLGYKNNQLTSLDVSQNTALVSLFGEGNQLTSLDVSQNTALTYLGCDSNQLNCLNVKNGNSMNMNFRATNNPNLTCIEVDDVAYATTNWTIANGSIDGTASFSTDCNNPCSSSTTGIAEYGHSFNLYPNPTTSIVTADGIKGTFELFNILGKLMQTSKTNTIDLTQLARGIYLLKATDEQGRVYSQKIIKE